MTPDDPRHPRHPRPDPSDDDARRARDDLASALLDGVLSEEEAAEARRRPDVVARVAAMEAARAALREAPSPTLPAAARDRAVAAALAAFDDAAPRGAGRAGDAATVARRDDDRSAGRTPVGADRSGVTELGARRHAERRGAPRWLAAAAAFIVVVGGMVGLAIATSTSSDDQSSETAGVAEDSAGHDDERATADEAQSADEAPSAEAEAGGAAGGLAAGEVGDLGTFPTTGALADRVSDLLRGDGATAGQDSVAPEPTLPGATELRATCPAGPPAPLADPGLGVRLHGRAVVEDRPVEVWVVDTGEGSRLVAIDDACAVVVDQVVG